MIKLNSLINSNIEQVLRSIPSVNRSIESDRKTRFSVYVSILKMGFTCQDEIVNNKLLELTPYEYYPCEDDVADSFSLSSQSIATLIKNTSPLINIDISDSDKESILELEKMLPTTVNQANIYLREMNVIDKSSSISGNAITLLLSLSTGNEFKKENVYTTPTMSGERHKRNSRESVPIILPKKISSSAFKSLCARVIRSASTLFNVIGFANIDVIVELELMMLMRSKSSEKVGVTEKTLRTIKQPKNNSPYSNYKIFHNLFTHIFSEKIGSNVIGETILFDDVDSTDFIEKIACYVRKTSSIKKNSLIEFSYRCLAFKSNNRPTKKQKNPERNSVDKLKYSDFYNAVDLGMFSNETLIEVIKSSNKLKIDEEKSKGNNLFFSYIDDDICNVIHPYMVEYFLNYLEFEKIKIADYPTTSANKILMFIAEQQREKIYEAINGDSGGYFSKDENENYFLTDENITFTENNSGKYIQPDYENAQEKLTDLIIEKQSYIQKLNSNFDLYEGAFKKEWGDGRSWLDKFSNIEFINDRNEWLTKSSPFKSKNVIKTEITVCEDKILLSKKRLNHLLEIKEKNDVVISNLRSRINRWEVRLQENLKSLESIESSETLSKVNYFNEQIESTEKYCRSLIIPPTSNKHYKVINQLIPVGEKISKVDLINEIETYLEKASQVNSEVNSGLRVSIFSLLSKHPYGTKQEDKTSL